MKLAYAVIGTALLIVACSPRESETARRPFEAAAAAAQTTRSQTEANPTQSVLNVQLRTFDALITALREHYVYGAQQNVGWEDLESRYRTRVLSLLRRDEFPDVIDAMIAELPSGAATWQSRAERIELQSNDASNYEGIGAYIAFRPDPIPRVILLSVMPGSPADQAGLRDHDSLLAVDGIAVRREEGENVVTRIRGPAGSVVTLSVRSPNQAPRDVQVRRGQVQLSEAANRLRFAVLPGSDVGYLLFPRQTTQSIGAEVVQSVQRMAAERPLRGLILDLRVAAIGAGWPLEEMLSVFGDGAFGELYSNTETLALNVTGQEIAGSQTLPLAILVGPDTEGRAEIFAAALQSKGRATLFGMRTKGNIEGNWLEQLPDGSRAYITSNSYRTAGLQEIGLTGLEPNLRVGLDWDRVTEADDPVRTAAASALVQRGNQ